MKQVFKIREDGTFDFSDSIVTDVDVEGYGEPDPTKHYKDDGTEMTEDEIDAIRNVPAPPTSEQKIAALEAQLAVEREDKLMVMEALAGIYESVLALKEGGGAA